MITPNVMLNGAYFSSPIIKKKHFRQAKKKEYRRSIQQHIV